MNLPILSGVRGRCPECGEGRLFKNFLEIEPCSACGLDLRDSNPGDGLSTLVFLIVGGLGCFGIVWSELTFKPPVWVLAVFWPPVIGALSIALLWPFKGLMIALLYRTQAAEAVARVREARGAPGAGAGGPQDL